MSRLNDKNEEKNTLLVTGNSMCPTLKRLDIVLITPCEADALRIGDVIVFTSPKNGDVKVAHRVSSVSAAGILTWGDNCENVDEWIVSREGVLGMVEQARRGPKRLRVYGGPPGRMIGGYHHLKLKGKHLAREWIYVPVTTPLVFIYRYLSRSGVFRRWLPDRLKPRILSFNRGNGVELRLVMGKKKIGKLEPTSKRWLIKVPYKLFVDERSLPGLPVHPPADDGCKAGESCN